MSLSNMFTIMTSSLGYKTTVGIVGFSCYVVACRALRYLRRNQKHALYPYKTREDFAKMTGEHAWEIVKYCMSLEFPFLSEKALQFALFRCVYPIR